MINKKTVRYINILFELTIPHFLNEMLERVSETITPSS